jgi:hypothetical protein
MDFSCRGELRAQGTSRAGSPDVGVAHVVPDHRHRLVTRHPHDGAVRGAPTGGAAPKLYDAEITGLAEAAKRASGRAIPAAKAANEILRALTASRDGSCPGRNRRKNHGPIAKLASHCMV